MVYTWAASPPATGKRRTRIHWRCDRLGKQLFRKAPPHVHQIENLNTRLEKAREIAKKKRIFPVYNNEDHYVVRTDDGKGFYIVNAEGCCHKNHQQMDLLEGYCEHRLAVDLYKEAQEAATASWESTMDDEAPPEADEESGQYLGPEDELLKAQASLLKADDLPLLMNALSRLTEVQDDPETDQDTSQRINQVKSIIARELGARRQESAHSR